jgi:hypothetical protein
VHSQWLKINSNLIALFAQDTTAKNILPSFEYELRDRALPNFATFDHIPSIHVVTGGAPSPEQIEQTRGFQSLWPRRNEPHRKYAGSAVDDKISRIPDCRTLVPAHWASSVHVLALGTILSTRRQAASARDVEARCCLHDRLDRKMDRPNASLLEKDGMIVLTADRENINFSFEAIRTRIRVRPDTTL